MITEKTALNGYMVEVIQDEYSNPLDLGYGFSIVIHPRAKRSWGGLGSPKSPDPESLGEWEVVCPLFGFDHSGQKVSLSPFSCPWDSGQIGWIGITKKAQEEIGFSDPRGALESFVKTINHWIQGDFSGYIIKSGDGEDLDSCFGFETAQDAREAGLEYVKGLPPFVSREEMEDKDWQTVQDLASRLNDLSVLPYIDREALACIASELKALANETGGLSRE